MSTSFHRPLILAADFLRWWRDELLALVPERLRELSQHKGQVVLMLADGSAPATLFVEASGASTVLAEIAEPGSPEARTQVQAVLRKPEIAKLVGRGGFSLCLRLPSRSALCRTINLPLAADGNLSEVVGFELDRYTPFRPEQVYYTHRVLTRDPAAQRLSAEITVVPRPIVDEALATARALGWLPDRVDVADPDSDASHSNNLLKSTVPAARSNGARVTYGLAVMATILAVAAIAIPLVAAEREAAVMTEEVATLEKQAQSAAVLQKDVAALRDGDDFLVKQKQRSRTVSELLSDITHLLPDDTWLTDFRITGSDVELTGVSGSASGLIGILEQSKQFRDTNFRSPVTTDAASGRERFSIAAHIVQERQ